MRRFLFLFLFSGIFWGQIPGVFAQRTPPGYWITIGAPQDTAESKISSEGVLQPFPNGFTLTPLIELEHEWISRDEVERNLYFEEDYLPIPNIAWNTPDLRFETQTFAWGPPDQSLLFVRYRLQNKSARPLKGKIYFVMQQAPQGKVDSIEFSEEAQTILVNRKWEIELSSVPAEAGFIKPEAGNLIQKIKSHQIPQIHSAKDARGKASGVWNYDFGLEPGEETTLGMVIPLSQNKEKLETFNFREAFVQASSFWRKKLQTIHWDIQDTKIQDALRLGIASLFIIRDNPGIYFDEFSKREAWTDEVFGIIRTYLLYGFLEEAREDLEMIALRMDPLGEIPPRMRGTAPLKEYQLQGQFVAAVLDTYQSSHDETWLDAKWPLVKRTLDSLKQLRAKRVTSWYASENPDRNRFYGILPPSNRHGDTKVLNQHRYEDDFWALKGWRDGRKIAEILGKSEEIRAIEQEEVMLRRALFESIEKVAKSEDVSFIPESAEKPFFDSKIAGLVAGFAEETAAISPERLRSHLETAVGLFEKAKKNKPSKAFQYSDFSVIQALLRQGKKEDAMKLFQFQWENLKPGDFDKATGFAQTLHDFFVYEAGDQLILGAGLLPEWISPKTGLHMRYQTRFGEIAYDLTPSGRGYMAHVAGDAQPPGGFVLKSPKSAAQQAFHRLPLDFQIE